MKAFSFKVFSEGISFKSYNELKFYGMPEICFTGRSNVGKSSLINAITNNVLVFCICGLNIIIYYT